MDEVPSLRTSSSKVAQLHFTRFKNKSRNKEANIHKEDLMLDHFSDSVNVDCDIEGEITGKGISSTIKTEINIH